MIRGSLPHIRLPVTAQIHSQMLTASTSQDRLTVWAIAAIAFFGFFRLGDLLPESTHSFNPATDLAWGNSSGQPQYPNYDPDPSEEIQVRSGRERSGYHHRPYRLQSLPSISRSSTTLQPEETKWDNFPPTGQSLKPGS